MFLIVLIKKVRLFFAIKLRLYLKYIPKGCRRSRHIYRLRYWQRRNPVIFTLPIIWFKYFGITAYIVLAYIIFLIIIWPLII